MTDQELHKVLARDGECWHEDISKSNQIFKCPCGFKTADYYTFEFHLENNENLNFSKPDGFFWAWERAQEKEWWGDFCHHLMAFGGLCMKIQTPLAMFPDKYYLSPQVINPTRFTEALKQFLERRDMDEIKRIKERYTKVEKHPAFESGYAVILKIGVQSFRLDYVADTLDEAEWVRDMLAKALKTFLEEGRHGH